MHKFEISNHEPSFLPDGEWKLVWADEFDGTELDESKWNFRLDFWGKHSPTFSKDVLVDGNSCIHLPLVLENGVYKSAHLQTGSLTYDVPKDSEGFWPFGAYKEVKFMHKFGYYEIRCKLPKNDGWHAAFWLQAPGIGSHPNPKYCGVEVDIMESYKLPTEGNVICGIGYGGYGKNATWPGHIGVPLADPEAFHTYAVDWSEDGYIFYLDGQEISRRMAPEHPVSHVEQFILVSTECHGYHRGFANEDTEADLSGNANVWAGKPVPVLLDAKLPDEFVVDYVRVFEKVK